MPDQVTLHKNAKTISLKNGRKVVIMELIILLLIAYVVYKLFFSKDTNQNSKNTTNQNNQYNRKPTNQNSQYNRKPTTYNPTPKPRTHTINDCYSSEDIIYNIDSKQKQLEDRIEYSKRLVAEAKSKGYLTANTDWVNRFKQMVEVSNTLNENLIYENQRRLNYDIQAKAGRSQMYDLINDIRNKKVRVPDSDREKLVQLKDAFREATDFLYNRMKSINNQTASLRDKIGAECGERGKQWWAERMKGRV